MLRSTDMNNHIENKYLDFKEVLSSLEFAEKIGNEIKELESRNWQEDDGKDEGKDEGKDDGKDDGDDEEPIFTIFGKINFIIESFALIHI
jgi:hypothetical protein